MHIFLDDRRTPDTISGIPQNVEWVKVKSIWELRDVLKALETSTHPEIEFVSFDYDLKASDRPNSPERGLNNGYWCAREIYYYCEDNDLPMPRYYVHSRSTSVDILLNFLEVNFVR